MIRWVLEARDIQGQLIGKDDEVWQHSYTGLSAIEAQARTRWPDAAQVRAYHWFDDRDDSEVFSPIE